MCAALSLASVVPQRSFVATKLSQLQAVTVALARRKELSVTMNLGASVVTVIEYILKVGSCYFLHAERMTVLTSLKAIPIGSYTHLNFAFAFIVMLSLKTCLIECHH